MKSKPLPLDEFISRAKGREVWAEHVSYGSGPRKVGDKIHLHAPHETLQFSYYTAKTAFQHTEVVPISEKDNSRDSAVMKQLKLKLPFVPPGTKLVPEEPDEETS